MIKYFILYQVLFALCNSLYEEKENYMYSFYPYNVDYPQKKVLIEVEKHCYFPDKGYVNTKEDTKASNYKEIRNKKQEKNTSCYLYCIIYLIISFLTISFFIYYSRIQFKKRKKKESEIKRMEDNIKNANKMIEACETSNEEILRIYRIMVQLSVSPRKNRYQKFLLDFNNFIYNNNDEFQFDWNSFETLLNKVCNRYVDKIRSSYPNISEKEVQIITMQKAGFDIPDIAIILEYSINTVYKRNSDIRKKLGVPELGNIIHFIDDELR